MNGGEGPVRALYDTLIGRWNARDATGYAALLERDATVIGFDGSLMEGAAAVEKALARIFADHPTAAYVTIVKGVRMITPAIGLLSAVAGMVPPGKDDILPARNAVQSLVAHGDGGEWRIALFQNTPAKFDGRPEAAAALDRELREALRTSRR
jgi:uncharacterized protein (TIGR02246 family)